MAGKGSSGCVVGCIVIILAILIVVVFCLFSPGIYAFIKDLMKTSSF